MMGWTIASTLSGVLVGLGLGCARAIFGLFRRGDRLRVLRPIKVGEDRLDYLIEMVEQEATLGRQWAPIPIDEVLGLLHQLKDQRKSGPHRVKTSQRAFPVESVTATGDGSWVWKPTAPFSKPGHDSKLEFDESISA